MTSALTVSVVIVSRERPDALRRCLMAISQMAYHPFEVVVVADPASCAHMRGWPQAARVRVVPYDQANISAARNLGVNEASGDIIAFVDDDAVPEPTWLTYLISPFLDARVVAAGGWVRGRNGISWQSRSQSVDCAGRTKTLEVDPGRATVFTARPGRAIKTEGTNMAVRRSCLAAIGGFDRRYRFFLDETDLNLRLAAMGAVTALVPRAEVHHGFEASTRRRSDRVPTDLFEIGASWAIFLETHCPASGRKARWAEIQAEEHRRALRHMVSGALEPQDVGRLMRGLQAGYQTGLQRGPARLSTLPEPSATFRPFAPETGTSSVVIAGRIWSRNKLLQRARRDVAAGHITSLFCFSPTALFHRVQFSNDGVWQQFGGLFGRSERTQRLFRFWRFKHRVRAESDRIGAVRGIS